MDVFVSFLTIPFPKVLGDVADDASLTGGVSDAAQPDEKCHQGSAVSAVSALCVDRL